MAFCVSRALVLGRWLLFSVETSFALNSVLSHIGLEDSAGSRLLLQVTHRTPCVFHPRHHGALAYVSFGNPQVVSGPGEWQLITVDVIAFTVGFISNIV